MSDTKWRKLIAAVEQSGSGVREMTLKFIDSDDPRRMKFPPDLRCPWAYVDTIEFGPIELRAIEWMELSVNLEHVLRTAGRFPIEVTGGHSRIIGYR